MFKEVNNNEIKSESKESNFSNLFDKEENVKDTEKPEESAEDTENPEESAEDTENPEESAEDTEKPEESAEDTEKLEESAENTKNTEINTESTEKNVENDGTETKEINVSKVAEGAGKIMGIGGTVIEKVGSKVPGPVGAAAFVAGKGIKITGGFLRRLGENTDIKLRLPEKYANKATVLERIGNISR